MCGQWGKEGVTKRQDAHYVTSEIPLAGMKAIVDNLAAFRPNITIFGGEPILYPGCTELIAYIKEKGMHCLMITNSSLLEGAAAAIVAGGLDELNISLDGGAALHDEIRGQAGLFERIMKGLKKVQTVKAAVNEKKPLINIQCTVTKYNYTRLEQLIDVAKEAAADSLTFHNLIFLDRKTLEAQKEFDSSLGCASTDWGGFCFEPGIDPGMLYDKIAAIRSGKYKFAVDFYPHLSKKELAEYYTNPEYVPPAAYGRCASPWMAAYIFPDGEVRPCLNSDYSYGNAATGRFTELWNAPRAVDFRRFLKAKCRFPACVRCTELYRY